MIPSKVVNLLKKIDHHGGKAPVSKLDTGACFYSGFRWISSWKSHGFDFFSLR